MSKSTDTEIKDLIGSIDRKLDLLVKEVSSVREEVSSLRQDMKGLDNRLWSFGSLILAACLGVFVKALNI
jgi:hypothetical protein